MADIEWDQPAADSSAVAWDEPAPAAPQGTLAQLQPPSALEQLGHAAAEYGKYLLPPGLPGMVLEAAKAAPDVARTGVLAAQGAAQILQPSTPPELIEDEFGPAIEGLGKESARLRRELPEGNAVEKFAGNAVVGMPTLGLGGFSRAADVIDAGGSVADAEKELAKQTALDEAGLSIGFLGRGAGTAARVAAQGTASSALQFATGERDPVALGLAFGVGAAGGASGHTERAGAPEGAAESAALPEIAATDETADLVAQHKQGILTPDEHADLADRLIAERERGTASAPTEEHAAVTQRFADKLQDFDGARAQYEAIPETKGGSVINTDIARELSPDYLADRTLSAAVHEPASAFAKRLYAEKLAQATPEGKDNTVLFTAGGTGAGKSTGLESALNGGGFDPEIVYDTNMNKLDSARAKIEQALDAGRNVDILYTYRDPVEAFTGGALKRAMRQESEFGSGRSVPLDEHVKTHVGASDVVRQIADTYKDDPRVHITAYDNSRGEGNGDFVPLESLPSVEYTGLKDKLINARDEAFQQGKISQSVWAGFGGDVQSSRAGALPQGFQRAAATAAESGAAVDQRGAAGSEPAEPAESGAPQHLDREAIAQDILTRELPDEIGWDQRGGLLMRAPLEDHSGALGEVTGRTQWVPKFDPRGGYSGFWPGYRTGDVPGTRLNEKQAAAALRKVAAGEPLGKVETRFIDYAREYAGKRADEHLQDHRDFQDDVTAKLADQRLSDRAQTTLASMDPQARDYMRSVMAHHPQTISELATYLEANADNPHLSTAVHEAASEVHDANQQTRSTVSANAGRDAHGAENVTGLSDPRAQARALQGQPDAAGTAETDLATAERATTTEGLPGSGAGTGVAERQPSTAGQGGSAGNSAAPGGPGGGGPARPIGNAAPPPGTPAQAAGLVRLTDPKAVKEAGRGVFREAWAQRDIASARADVGLDYFRREYDKRPRDVLTDPSRALAPIIDFQQGGITAVNDPLTASFLHEATRMIADRTARIQNIGVREGKPLLQTLRENYFPQAWEQTKGAMDWASNYYRKSPMQGDRSFLKGRVFDDLEEGIRAGYTPVSHNPVDLVMGKLWQMDKFIATHEAMGKLDAMGLMRDHPMDKAIPDGWGRVNDYTFTGKIVPKSVSDSINNVLDPGLNKYAVWRGIRYAQNTILSARLGFSAFHAGFTTFDTLAAHMGDALDRVAMGDAAGAAKSFGKGLISPALSPLEGRKYLRQALGIDHTDDPHTAAILESLVSGGMRVRMDPTDTNNAYAQFGRALRQHDLGALAKTAVPAFLESSTRYIMNSLVPYQKMAARVMMAKTQLDHLAGFVGTEPGDYAGTIANANPVVLREVMGKVNQLVDDRLGQVAYDNRFWNSTGKHVAQFLIQAPGWNVGTINVVGRPFLDAAQLVAGKTERYAGPAAATGAAPNATFARLSPRITYMAGALGAVALYGALRQYLTTGQAPESTMDLIMPRVGGNNPDGSPTRENLPSYVKDAMEYKAHPLRTGFNKLNPTLSMLYDLFVSNKDYFGNEVRNPADSKMTQAKQVGSFLLHENTPYAWQNAARNMELGKPLTSVALPFLGVTPAPSSVTRSPFEDALSDSLAQYHTMTTPEQAAARTARYTAENQIRMGQNVDLTTFDPKARQQIVKDVAQPQLVGRYKALVGRDRGLALQAFESANPEERVNNHLQHYLFAGAHEGQDDMTRYGRGWHKYLATLDESERGPMLQRLKAAYDWRPTGEP